MSAALKVASVRQPVPARKTAARYSPSLAHTAAALWGEAALGALGSANGPDSATKMRRTA